MFMVSAISLGFIIVAYGVVMVWPGHLSIDEITYHLMTKNVSEGRFTEVLNGFHEFPSEEFVTASFQAREDRLVPMPPITYSLIAAPFYFALGYRGLFLMNGLACMGVVALTYIIARRLTRDVTVARLSCFFLVGASFLPEYAVASWPHALSCLLVLICFWFLLNSNVFSEEVQRLSPAWLFYSGLILGITIGVRYDAIFMLPVLVFPILLRRPLDHIALINLLLGLVPGIAFLTLSNWFKFGELTPFTYGNTAGYITTIEYLPLLILGILAMMVIAVTPTQRIGILLAGLLGFVLVLSLLVWPLRAAVFQLAGGAYQLLVDFRVRDLSIMERGLSRGPGGSMLYIGAVKKSLLQSLPWLPLILVPLSPLLKKSRGHSDLLGLTLLLPVVFYFLPYAYRAWHGGLSLNLRYFTPILPFLSILAASGWSKLFPNLNRNTMPITTIVVSLLTFGAVFFASVWLIMAPLQTSSIEDAALGTGGSLREPEYFLLIQEMIFLSAPLVLAFALAVFVVLNLLGKKSQKLSAAGWIIAVICVCWSSAVAYGYDLLRSAGLRSANYRNAEAVARMIQMDSVVLTPPSPDSFFSLKEFGNVRIANPYIDNFADFNPLVTYYSDKEVPVYMATGKGEWERLQADGTLSNIISETIMIAPGYSLKRLYSRGL